jgi:hypothetical protein
MPKFDGTGPNGKGPMTGRGSGYCVIPLNTTEQEFGFLRNQERVLKQQLNQIATRIKSLNAPGAKTTIKTTIRSNR